MDETLAVPGIIDKEAVRRSALGRRLIGPLVAVLMSLHTLPAAAAIAVTDAGTASQASGVSTSVTAVTTAPVAAGDVLRVAIVSSTSALVTSITDGLGNTYSQAHNYNAGSIQMRAYYTVASTAIPSGTSISLTFNTASGGKLVNMQKITGLVSSPLDIGNATGATGVSTSVSITTGTLAQADEIVIADERISTGAGDSYSENNGFALANSVTQSTDIFRTIYKVVSSTAAQAPSTTISSSRTWHTNYNTFKGQPTVALTFGVKTRSCHGGFPSGQAGGTTLTGTDASDFVIDPNGDIVPSGTCDAVKTFSKSVGQTYNLAANGTSYDITLVANAAHVTSTASDTGTSFQLRTLLNTASGSPGPITCGDTIYLRGGSHLNPTGALFRVRPPSGGYTCASGRITVRSETAETGVDGNGNPLRGGGAKIGSVSFDPGSSGDILYPIDFRYVTFYVDIDGASRANFFGYTSAGGYGIGCYECRFENGPNVSDANADVNGFELRSATVDKSHFKRMNRAITGNGTAARGSTITDSVYESLWVDGVTISGENWNIARNFGFNFLFRSGAHPDCIQHLGAVSGNLTGIVLDRNICVRNVGPSNGDAQGYFQSDTPSPNWIFGGVYTNNIANLTASQGLTLTRFDGAQVNYNTIVTAVGNPFGTVPPSEPSLTMAIQASTSQNSTFTRNASTGYALGSNTSVSNTPALTKTLTAMQMAFPSYVGGANPGMTTRVESLRQFTPANVGTGSGGVMNADGTASGALFPACPGQTIGAWNDGTIWNCSDATWLGAHPPAQ